MHKLLYFNFFSASFCTTFLSISVHVFSFLFLIDYYYYYCYYYYSALRPVLAEIRAQSGDRCGSGTLYSGQILKGSLPLLSPGSIYTSIKKHFKISYLDNSRPPPPPHRDLTISHSAEPLKHPAAPQQYYEIKITADVHTMGYKIHEKTFWYNLSAK
jgi:hypothetical protein